MSHGKPLPPDVNEPSNLASTIAQMRLRYVVITSVDRDDLMDGGARHFVDCIEAVRMQSPAIKIEVLVPDFRGRLETAVEILRIAPPDVMNHNLETVPRLYKQARPGADYQNSLNLLKLFGELRFVTPERFAKFEQQALAMGFTQAACGPMVRSSYHADTQANAAGVFIKG